MNRARNRKLTLADVQGGTFTVNNPGAFGSVMSQPIINQPQAAIVTMEAIVKRPVVVTDSEGNDNVLVRSMTKDAPFVRPPGGGWGSGRALFAERQEVAGNPGL